MTMLASNDHIQILGKGAYTVAEAFRLTGVNPARIRRWLDGREYSRGDHRIIDRPLWRPELPKIEGAIHLTFRDLIELRMVDRFRAQQISMPYLRKVVEAAQRLLSDTHPFSTSHFKTDGRKLYLEVLSETKEPALIEVLSGQHTFHSIISHGLKDIHFEDGIAAWWRPESGRGEVVIDPQRSFGQPVLERHGIPTATIKVLTEAGRSVRQISVDFEVDEKAVRAAIAFEDRLAA